MSELLEAINEYGANLEIIGKLKLKHVTTNDSLRNKLYYDLSEKIKDILFVDDILR